jgi:hypothetical protein
MEWWRWYLMAASILVAVAVGKNNLTTPINIKSN